MKHITKIQSISDLITNSSSEVFVMDSASAHYYDSIDGCISIREIDEDWVRNEGQYEHELICSVCGLDAKELGMFEWEPDDEIWDMFLELHWKEIKEKLVGLYFVDIEDHFEDAYEVSRSARHDSIWSDYRH